MSGQPAPGGIKLMHGTPIAYNLWEIWYNFFQSACIYIYIYMRDRMPYMLQAAAIAAARDMAFDSIVNLRVVS